MSFYIYDVGIHNKDASYQEFGNVEFSNPVNVGDHITHPSGGGSGFVVFQVEHSSVGGGSCLHVKRAGI